MIRRISLEELGTRGEVVAYTRLGFLQDRTLIYFDSGSFLIIIDTPEIHRVEAYET